MNSLSRTPGMSAPRSQQNGFRYNPPTGPSAGHTNHTIIQRPTSRRQGPNNSSRLASPSHPIRRQISNAWDNLLEITIILSGLRYDETTWNIFRNFKRQGNILFVEIFEGTDGKKTNRGKIKFSAPVQPFWVRTTDHNPNGFYAMQSLNEFHYNIVVDFKDKEQKRYFKIQSPIRPSKAYDQRMTINPSKLHFGLMVEPTSMMHLQTVNSYENPSDLAFVVDLVRKCITAEFTIPHRDPTGEPGEYDRNNK
jgi:RNA-dependent RNA polymerase